MKKLLILIIIGLPFLITNCNEKTKPQFFIDQETKDFTVFQKGTYWVYQNQFNELDSQSVIDFDRSLGNPHYHYDPESFQLNIKSSYYNDEMIYQCNIDVNNMNIFYVKQMWASSFIITSNSYVSAKNIDESIYNLKLTDTLKNYNNNYSEFSHVKKFEVITGEKNSYSEIYWSKHIGRIEYLDSEGKRWKLKRFKIIQ